MEKGKKNRKQVIIGISVLLLVTLLLLGLTYAYYRTRIIGNTNSESISVTSKNLEVTYQDDEPQVITETGISPGYTKEKKFSVANTGGGEASYSIKLDNVENTFVRFSDWKYKLYKGDEKDTPIAEGIIGHGEEQTIKSYETVSSPGTNTYTLEIEYENSITEDQSIDMGATLSLRINIDNAIGDELRNATQGTLLHAIGKDNPNIISPITIPGKEPSGLLLGAMGEATDEMTVEYPYQSYHWTYADGYNYDLETGRYELTGVKTGLYTNIYSQLAGKYLVSAYDSGNSTFDNTALPTTNLSTIYQVVEATEDKITYKTSVKDFKEAELSYTEDDYGTSYYFRGSVENNYVTMGSTCWRIVRVQGDGSIKITLYDETHSCEESTGATGVEAFISETGDGSEKKETAYSAETDNWKGVVFSTSIAKSTLDDWYGFKTPGIRDQFENVIVKEAKWCNDVSGYAENDFEFDWVFGALDRLYFNRVSLKCHEPESATLGTSTYVGPIALLTVDEISFAGGSAKSGFGDFYLISRNAGRTVLTMSPAGVYWDYYGPVIFIMSSAGFSIDHAGGQMSGLSCLRPALVLKSTVTIDEGGKGTKDNPYVISQN